MKSDTPSSEKGRRIIVIADTLMQNTVFTGIIKKSTGLPCILKNQFEQLFSLLSDDETKLILIDMQFGKIKSVLNYIRDNRKICSDYIVSLFNVQREHQMEEQAILWGVRGFFYKDSSLDHILKGITVLFDGEYWVSRDVLIECMLQTERIDHMSPMDVRKRPGDLTDREVEILAMICKGSNNHEIADHLYISTNTVKTHIYNIYRKINVPNRMQAALWGAKNL
jgi:LuxR family transcriptional regulator of csgAB operon